MVAAKLTKTLKIKVYQEASEQGKAVSLFLSEIIEEYMNGTHPQKQ